MKPIQDFADQKLKILFSDIDGTITEDGQISSHAYAAMWRLKENGIHLVPVTGRPAGWCEMIARFWPVRGVIGENGALYFTYKNQKMNRKFVSDPSKLRENREKLDRIAEHVLKQVPGTALASDQFCRLFDLAIDFAEDVKPLSHAEVAKIVAIFDKNGATAKVSHIHVNGWFGTYDKVSMCKTFLTEEMQLSLSDALAQCAFVGDSPNDEPMFQFFPLSFGVANIVDFKDQIKHLPTYIASQYEGKGFCEIADQILSSKLKKS